MKHIYLVTDNDLYDRKNSETRTIILFTFIKTSFTF